MAAVDSAANLGLNQPAHDGCEVTSSDKDDLPNVSRWIYVGSTGDVQVILMGGQTVLFTAVPAGTLLPIRVTRVMAAGTTASDVVALW